MCKYFITLFSATILTMTSVGEARPPDRTLQQIQIPIELTLTPQLLTCTHDLENRADHVTLIIPAMPSNPVFKHGLTLTQTLDLWFDSGCDETELATSMAKFGGKLKTTASVTVSEKWYGGYGDPCQKVLVKQIDVPLMPMEYLVPSFSKTTVLKTYPSSLCNL